MAFFPDVGDESKAPIERKLLGNDLDICTYVKHNTTDIALAHIASFL